MDGKAWGASRRRTPGGTATGGERTREGLWVIIAESEAKPGLRSGDGGGGKRSRRAIFFLF